jgi:hypothetical protein
MKTAPTTVSAMFVLNPLSDSDKNEILRDTKVKKSEYEYAGVREYYILDPSSENMYFYERTSAGVYIEIQPDSEGVIRSTILPGFQFQHSDLKAQTVMEELALDEVYQGYVLLKYQEEKRRADAEQQRADACTARGKCRETTCCCGTTTGSRCRSQSGTL